MRLGQVDVQTHCSSMSLEALKSCKDIVHRTHKDYIIEVGKDSAIPQALLRGMKSWLKGQCEEQRAERISLDDALLI